MKQHKSLALLVCYLGKLPWYFDYFVHSCKYNPTVDFYIITDDKTWYKPLPANVKLIYKTFEEISMQASDSLGFNVKITFGYKLCDFKPAYGVIFSNILGRYDFWGHCDIDIILGNIREFITDELLEIYDMISVRPDWIPGCFLLYKNVDKMNRLFLHSKDYKKVFVSNKHHCFDETNFAHDEFKTGKPYTEIRTEVESMMHVVKKMEKEGHIKPLFDFFMIEGLPGKLKWQNGRMYYRNKYEILLFHLMYLKDIYNPMPLQKGVPDRFTISPTKIYHQQSRFANS